MNDIFGKTSEELFLVSNVRSLTFDGIDSDLLTMMDNPLLEDLVKIPFDKFGFFYQVIELNRCTYRLHNIGNITNRFN